MNENDGVYIRSTNEHAGKHLATTVSLALSCAVICAAVFLSGSPESFINPTFILILIGAASFRSRENPRCPEMPLNNLSPLSKCGSYVN